MAISDALSERRNLVLASTCIIVFYAAGGFVREPTVRLAIVNVSFHHPEVLGWFVWAFLIWFQVRFWQATKSKFSAELAKEIREWSVPSIWARPLVKIAERQAGGKDKLKPGYTALIHVPEISNGTIKAVCSFIYEVNGQRSAENQQEVTLKSWSVHIFFLVSFFRSLIVGNAFAEYFFPYILFLAAVFAPVWSCWL